MNNLRGKIVLNHYLDCYEGGRDMRMLYDGLNNCRWVSAKKGKKLFLLARRSINPVLCLPLLLLQVFVLTFPSFPVWFKLVLVSGILIVSFFVYKKQKRELSFLPKRPLAVIDLEKSALSIFRRGVFPGIQIRARRLTVGKEEIEKLEWVYGDAFTITGDRLSLPVIGGGNPGPRTFSALYLHYADKNRGKELLFVAMPLRNRIYRPIVEQLHLKLEYHTGTDVPP